MPSTPVYVPSLYVAIRMGYEHGVSDISPIPSHARITRALPLQSARNILATHLR